MSSTRASSSIVGLSISPRAPIYHLTPDPILPTPSSLLSLSSYVPSGPGMDSSGGLAPSQLRRSRQVQGGGCFSYVSPLPIEFPYSVQQPAVEGAEKKSIESHLAEFELDPSAPVQAVRGQGEGLTSAAREAEAFPKPRLLALSKRAARDWLPQLDLGDPDGDEDERAVREELVAVLSGKTVIARVAQPDAEEQVAKEGFAPWSLCYGGHQFGSWAGQLGDGRAISLLSTPTTPEVKVATGGADQVELQLKGAGRTPYSRFADGLAVLRSSVREFLGAEASNALRLPTSRALALVALPTVEVQRERIESAAIVTRLAQSWIRIGNFEIQRTRQEWGSLRALTRFVGREVFYLDDASPLQPREGVSSSRGLGATVLAECSRRTALMIAGWQATGFQHGVMNTDNFSITGEAIDFGPFAWMDIFDPNSVCNHSDELERYSFKMQPTMGLFAINKLGEAMAEVIGCEEGLIEEGQSDASSYVEVPEDWAEVPSRMKGYQTKGMERVEKIKEDFTKIFMDEYTRLMRLKLGFATSQEDDFSLAARFLTLLSNNDLDHSSSHRVLSQFPGLRSTEVEEFLDLLLPKDRVKEPLQASARDEAKAWLEDYEKRLSSEEESAHAEGRRKRMDGVNPRFVLRQWILEETIAKLDRPESEQDIPQLERVLELASEPFESYGERQLGGEGAEVCPTEEERERQRLCGIGSEAMLGFQCSCSS